MKTNLIKPVTNIISNPRVLGPAVFIAVGGGKTLKDFTDAKPEEKKMILLKDTAILAGSVLAFAAINPLTKAFCNTKFVNILVKSLQKLVSNFRGFESVRKNKVLSVTKKIAEKTEFVLKESIACTLNTFAGVLGAVYANAFMQKYVLSKLQSEKDQKQSIPDEQNNLEDKQPQADAALKVDNFTQTSNVFSKFNYANSVLARETAKKVAFSLPDLGDIKFLERPMIALMGYSVAETQGYHNKFKKTSYDLLANTLIPTVLVSAAGLAVRDKKPLIKYASLFIALCAGLVAGKLTADYVKDKLDKTIDSIDMKYIAV